MEFSRAITLAQLVSDAYKRKLPADPPYTPSNGYTVLANLQANDLITRINPLAAIAPYGFIAQNGEDIVVAIRGTDNWLAWFDDAQFFSKPCPIPNVIGRTEDGFSDVYMSMQVLDGANTPTLAQFLGGFLKPSMTLSVCGHSLGAALATLAAVDVATNVTGAHPSLYTFASPNVGDATFAQDFQSTVQTCWRVVNPFDVVTHVPTRFILGYEAVGQTVALNPAGMVKKELGCLHALDTYIYLMGYYGNVPQPKTACIL